MEVTPAQAKTQRMTVESTVRLPLYQGPNCARAHQSGHNEWLN